jgi:hypothetical protein
MATRRYAKAIASHHNVPYDEWMEVLRNQNEGAVPRDHVHRIAKTVLKKCDPKQFLLSHATIVASVDTYAPRGAKTGQFLNRGVQIDVRWPEYRIKPEVSSIINNNGDAWDRNLLLSTYRTFIGAQNYLEHIQVPELSKGFIVDAIARDLGQSCYIDILVATDRRHTQLVQDILQGKLSALSMGCISAFTICTKCGNVASDESQLCPCIQYEGKHTEYFDEDGHKHKIAELIGHSSIPNSNQFIEASWVANPAFKGAVRRNFLNADMEAVADKMAVASEIALGRSMVQVDGIKKAASQRVAQGNPFLDSLLQAGGGEGQDAPPDSGGGQAQAQSSQPVQGGGQGQGVQGQGGQGQGQGGGEDKKDEGDPNNIKELIKKGIEDMKKTLVQEMVESMKNDLLSEGKEGEVLPPPKNLEKSNDNLHRASFDARVATKFAKNPGLVRWATDLNKIVMSGDKNKIRKANVSSRDLIILSWVNDNINGRYHSPDLYRIAMAVGPMKKFTDESSFHKACETKAKRSLSVDEKSFLSWKGKIANLAII